MDWLKKLNLPEPKTFQDVIAIAEAFKEMDPSQNYGFEAGTISLWHVQHKRIILGLSCLS